MSINIIAPAKWLTKDLHENLQKMKYAAGVDRAFYQLAQDDSVK
jgi:hypothetical protein